MTSFLETRFCVEVRYTVKGVEQVAYLGIGDGETARGVYAAWLARDEAATVDGYRAEVLSAHVYNRHTRTYGERIR